MKKTFIIAFIITMIFIGINKIGAIDSFPSSITIAPEGVALTLDDNLNVVNSTTSNYMWFHYKSETGGNAILCTAGTVTAPSGGITCNATNFGSSGQEKGVAYIINLINSSSGSSSNEKYWWTEFLINSYLGSQGYNFGSGQYTYINIINTDYKILNTGKTYNTIISEAKAAAAKTYTNNTLSVSGDLNFVKGSDGYYSAQITVTSNGKYNVTVDNNKFEVTNNSNVYTIKIKESNITAGGKESVNVTVSSKETAQTYYVAQNYNCGSGYQTVTLNQVKPVNTTVATPVKKTGAVSRESVSIKVAKVDNNGNFIANAKLLFQTEEEYNEGKGTNEIISKADGYVEITNLTPGTYYLSEKEAPSGYSKSEKIIKIVISNAGSITVDGKSSNGEIKVVNDLNKLVISKTDITGKEELPGAHLQIQDSEGNVVKSWISTDKPYEIEGLPVGTYYLVETLAPEGYVLNKEKVKFEITETTTTLDVEMTNKLNKVKISKLNITNKKELPGAHLQIEDKDGNIVKYCKDEKGNSGAECKWVSTDKPYEIEGFPVGTYYLVETLAPEGYVLSKEKIKFNIKETTEIEEVVMTNELEVDVPDTLSGRSALLLTIAMFDIALGIGIVTYVKKNKIEE